MEKRWSEYTVQEIQKIKKRDCSKCYYSSRITATTSTKNSMTCDYIHITGKMRGCIPGECREKNIFVLRDKRRQRKVRPIAKCS